MPFCFFLTLSAFLGPVCENGFAAVATASKTANIINSPVKKSRLVRIISFLVDLILLQGCDRRSCEKNVLKDVNFHLKIITRIKKKQRIHLKMIIRAKTRDLTKNDYHIVTELIE